MGVKCLVCTCCVKESPAYPFCSFDVRCPFPCSLLPFLHSQSCSPTCPSCNLNVPPVHPIAVSKSRLSILLQSQWPTGPSYCSPNVPPVHPTAVSVFPSIYPFVVSTPCLSILCCTSVLRSVSESFYEGTGRSGGLQSRGGVSPAQGVVGSALNKHQ